MPSGLIPRKVPFLDNFFGPVITNLTRSVAETAQFADIAVCAPDTETIGDFNEGIIGVGELLGEALGEGLGCIVGL